MYKPKHSFGKKIFCQNEKKYLVKKKKNLSAAIFYISKSQVLIQKSLFTDFFVTTLIFFRYCRY